MNLIFIFLFLLFSIIGDINFSHVSQNKLQFTNEEKTDLKKSGKFNNIENAVILVGNSLPKHIIKIFSNAKTCIKSNPIKNSDFYSYTTLYGAYNDLINYCASIEYNKLYNSKIDSEQMFFILLDWSNEVAFYVFDIKRDSQPLLDQYISKMACDSTINYHLFIASIMTEIKIKDFDIVKFLNYLFHNNLGDNEMCEDYRDYWKL